MRTVFIVELWSAGEGGVVMGAAASHNGAMEIVEHAIGADEAWDRKADKPLPDGTRRMEWRHAKTHEWLLVRELELKP